MSVCQECLAYNRNPFIQLVPLNESLIKSIENEYVVVFGCHTEVWPIESIRKIHFIDTGADDSLLRLSLKPFFIVNGVHIYEVIDSDQGFQVSLGAGTTIFFDYGILNLIHSWFYLSNNRGFISIIVGFLNVKVPIVVFSSKQILVIFIENVSQFLVLESLMI
jgi:hypothetical protein